MVEPKMLDNKERIFTFKPDYATPTNRIIFFAYFVIMVMILLLILRLSIWPNLKIIEIAILPILLLPLLVLTLNLRINKIVFANSISIHYILGRQNRYEYTEITRVIKDGIWFDETRILFNVLHGDGIVHIDNTGNFHYIIDQLLSTGRLLPTQDHR